jgi:eukaryotic-like serine/threonine-protein kinase
VLAIETARSGSATGEVTTVLRTLPRRTRRRVPLRLRQPIVAGALVLLAIVIIGGGILYLANRTHHGTGSPPPAPPAKTAQRGHGISLCQTCAHDYNPDALSGPKNQHPNQVGLAIDNNPNTAWSTETYDNDVLGKPGVGLYVDANPGVAAASMTLETDTPGYAVSIYGSKVKPSAGTFGPAWVKLATAPDVRPTQHIPLDTGGVPYRYYLVWITSLGEHGHVDVNEIALYT